MFSYMKICLSCINSIYFVLYFIGLHSLTAFSHCVKCSSNGAANGDANIFCVLTMCSSNSNCASSIGPPLRMLHPVFL